MCKPLIRAIDSSNLKDDYSTAQRVTYRYYVGRKAMFDSDFKQGVSLLLSSWGWVRGTWSLPPVTAEGRPWVLAASKLCLFLTLSWFHKGKSHVKFLAPRQVSETGANMSFSGHRCSGAGYSRCFPMASAGPVGPGRGDGVARSSAPAAVDEPLRRCHLWCLWPCVADRCRARAALS